MSNARNTKFTIAKVAELAKVSIRALRFYDEIGLLKPASYGENGYRYYGQEQLLLLQQILFYRELGFELALIQKIMSDPSFDKAGALRAHRESLSQQAEFIAAMWKPWNLYLDESSEQPILHATEPGLEKVFFRKSDMHKHGRVPICEIYGLYLTLSPSLEIVGARAERAELHWRE